ncbi:MAG TPA: isoprenylcysteine carboxylmethyltransferase family protein [Bryobacteraceae bacterium]
MQFRSIVGFGWLMFLAYWWISAVGVKKDIRRRSLGRGIGARILAIAVMIALTRLPFFQQQPSTEVNPIKSIAGLIICIAGFGLAVWARLYLGRNWGMPMSLKEGHELVMTGPYRYVRHPIYTGMLLAILGSALVNGPIWVVFFAGMAVYCVYSARTEESLMQQQFPEQYALYKRRTKAIVPFLI